MRSSRPLVARQAAARRRRFAGKQRHNAEARQAAARQLSASQATREPGDEGTGPLCPESSEHGHLRAWSGSVYVYYCADDRHTGFVFYRPFSESKA